MTYKKQRVENIQKSKKMNKQTHSHVLLHHRIRAKVRVRLFLKKRKREENNKTSKKCHL